MTEREKLQVKLEGEGYCFATEKAWDVYFFEYITTEHVEKTKMVRIEEYTKVKRECGLGPETFIVPIWFQRLWGKMGGE